MDANQEPVVIENESQLEPTGNGLKKVAAALQKHFFLFVLAFLTLISFVGVSLVNKTVQLRQKATGLVAPDFYFNPSTLTVAPGQQFQVQVKINAGGQPLSVAAFQINYNSQALQLTQITSGTIFPTVLRNQINNTIGKAFFDAGVALTNPVYFSGDDVFVQLNFQVNALATTSTQSIAFLLPDPNNPRSLGDCDLIGSGTNTGVDLLASVGNLTVTINAPSTSLTPTRPPATATPIPLSDCQKKNGVCCSGGAGNCVKRLIYFWLNNQITTSGGCNPNKVIDGAACCKSCRYPTPTPTRVLGPTNTPAAPTTTPITSPTPTRAATPTSSLTYCQQVGGVCCKGPTTSRCDRRKFWPGDPHNADQGGCNPSGVLPFSAYCCAKCK